MDGSVENDFDENILGSVGAKEIENNNEANTMIYIIIRNPIEPLVALPLPPISPVVAIRDDLILCHIHISIQ
jgi:hypothetical protein